MNAVVILNDTRKIIDYVENVKSVSAGDVIGETSNVRGVDLSKATIIVTEQTFDLYNKDGSINDITLPADIVDKSNLLPASMEQQIADLQAIVMTLI